jgi:hypothetical protein
MIYSLLLEFGHRSPALYRDLPRWRKVFGDLTAVLHRECEDVRLLLFPSMLYLQTLIEVFV